MFDQDIPDGARHIERGIFVFNGGQTTRPAERLPFTVRLIRNECDLAKAVAIRHQAYARHVPSFAEALRSAESYDSESGVVVLLAASKVDGEPLGTMRIQTNRFRPLSVEQSLPLPPDLARRPLAEATRLGVTEQKVGRLVKTVLFKAFYQYCLKNSIEAMVVTGRSPIDRQYERLMFEEVYPTMGFVALAHVGNLPHRVMSLNVRTAEARWRAANHPLLNFIVGTHHQDIDIGPKRAPFRPPARDKVQIFPTVFTQVAVKNL